MTLYRPGNYDITDAAMKEWNLEKGSKVLEIGSAEGDCTAYLTEKYGFEMTGLDIKVDMVSKAKKAHPGLDFRYGDGEILSDFMSYTFDGVVMECVLSLINLPDEALHEAYCVLKKGGKLFISDLYMLKPDPKRVKAIEIEARRQAKLRHEEGACETATPEEKMRFVDFRFKGRFLEENLIRQLKEIGFVNIKFEDRTEDLQVYAAQKILDGESADECLDCVKKDKKHTGYFMLTCEKPE